MTPVLAVVSVCTASCAIMLGWSWMLWTGRVHVYSGHWHSQTRVNPKASVPLLFIVTFPLVRQIQWHTPWESVSCCQLREQFPLEMPHIVFPWHRLRVWARYIWDLKVLFCKWESWSDSIVPVLNKQDNKIVTTSVIIIIILMTSTACKMLKQALFSIIFSELFIYISLVLFVLLLLCVSFKCETDCVYVYIPKYIVYMWFLYKYECSCFKDVGL